MTPFTTRLLPLGVAVMLAGCNPADTGDTGDDNDSGDTSGQVNELALAKAFVQDFSGLQESIMALETPIQDFATQVDADVETVEEADAEAFGRTVETVMSQLAEALDPMVEDGTGQGFQVNFVDASGDFAADGDLTFSDASSYTINADGTITASGVATLNAESVTFDIDLALPDVNTTHTGDIDYDLTANIAFTGDTLGLDVNNANGNLSLSLGSSSLGDLEDGPDSDDTINGISLGLGESTLTVGGLSLTGALDLDVTTLDFSNNGDNVDAAFSVSVEGELSNSAGESFAAGIALTDGSLNLDYQDTDSGWEETASAGLTYAVTAAFTTDVHDFDVTLNGRFNASFNIVDTNDGWSEDIDIGTDGGLVITHNDAAFQIDYDFDAAFDNTHNSGSEQVDMVIQDATETDHTVRILMGDYDDEATDAYEFAIVKVNGTQYGTIGNENDRTVAHFTDNSSIEVFSFED